MSCRFFGITSPKYYYELEEFKKINEEEEERKKKEAENTSGWLEQGAEGHVMVSCMIVLSARGRL